MLFRELPYLERPAAAARVGFTTVETWWPPEGLAAPWADEVLRHGLAVAAINSDGGHIERGERGFLNVPARRSESLQAFREAAELARRTGARMINVLIGREEPGRPRSEQIAEATAALADCVELAEAADLTILIEPINDLDVPGYLVPTVAGAVALIDALASDCVRLLYDAYHVARAGGDPCSEVGALVPIIGHVQYADCPGRGAPGTGRIDLRALVTALEDAGYSGAVGLELDPGDGTWMRALVAR
jgi:hydroxypyruvate isomerase